MDKNKPSATPNPNPNYKPPAFKKTKNQNKYKNNNPLCFKDLKNRIDKPVYALNIKKGEFDIELNSEWIIIRKIDIFKGWYRIVSDKNVYSSELFIFYDNEFNGG